MSQVPPVVRYLILCQDVQISPDEAQNVTLVNLISTIVSLQDPPFPLRHSEICIFVQLTECRSPVDLRIDIVQTDAEQVIFRTRTRTVPFENDPLRLVGLTFRIRGCLFPAAGIYEVQLCCNDKAIASQPLRLR